MSLVARIVAVSVFSVVAGVASAERLPKDAVKLSPAEVKAIYAGKSSDWSKSRAYFAPDGTYTIVGKNSQWVGKGKWTVDGNKVCAGAVSQVVDGGKGREFTDCWTWYKHGKRHLVLWSGEKDKKDGYWDGELKNLSKGDQVTRTYKKLLASN